MAKEATRKAKPAPAGRAKTIWVKPSTNRLIAERAKVWRRSQSSYLEELVLAEAGKPSTIPLAPVYTPTRAEKRAIEKGRAEITRGEFVTLDQLNAYLARLDRSPRSRGPRTRSAKRA